MTIERGPLVYALRIGEDWRRLSAGMSRPAPTPIGDWEVHPTTPSNYGLALHPDAPLADDAIDVRAGDRRDPLLVRKRPGHVDGA